MLRGSHRRSQQCLPCCATRASARSYRLRPSRLPVFAAMLIGVAFGRMAAAAFAGLATLLEAGHSHAFAMSHGPTALLLSQALHLLAAGAWLGGLLPLLIMVQEAPLGMAKSAARRFSAFGLVSVAILIVTAIFQGIMLSGGCRVLVGTAYGFMLLTKAVLFAVMIAIAMRNRFSASPPPSSPPRENNGGPSSFAAS
jgi:putative copper export protein